MKIKKDLTAKEFSAMLPKERLKNLRRMNEREWSRFRIFYDEMGFYDTDEEYWEMKERLNSSLTDEEYLAELAKIEAEEKVKKNLKD